jgi:hypothetical protein
MAEWMIPPDIAHLRVSRRVSVSQGFLCTTEPSIRDAEGTNEFDYGPNSSSMDSLPATDTPWPSSLSAFSAPWASSTDSLPAPTTSSSSVESLPDVESFIPGRRGDLRPAAGLPALRPPTVIPPPPPRSESIRDTNTTRQHTTSDVVVPEPVPAPPLVGAGSLSQRSRRNGNQEKNQPDYRESDSEPETTGKRKRKSGGYKPVAAHKRGGGAGRGIGGTRH